MIDWNDFYYFSLIAEEGSYTQAAVRAGISKSMLSRRMSALEERLGVRLIQRTTRRLSLTPAGEQFAAECRTLVNQGKQAQATVMAEQVQPQGLLRISAPVFVAESWLGELVSDFILRWPLANVQLLAVNRPVDMISEGIDISLVVTTTALNDSTFHARKLQTQRDILVTSPTWLAQNAKPETVRDLAQIPALVRLSGNSIPRWHLVCGQEAFEFEPKPRLQSNNLRVLLKAVLGGNGVALMPAFACQKELEAGNLQPLFPDWSTPPRDLLALYPARKGMPAITRIFIDELADRLASYPPQ